jgi:hypothetical protein
MTELEKPGSQGLTSKCHVDAINRAEWITDLRCETRIRAPSIHMSCALRRSVDPLVEGERIAHRVGEDRPPPDRGESQCSRAHLFQAALSLRLKPEVFTSRMLVRGDEVAVLAAEALAHNRTYPDRVYRDTITGHVSLSGCGLIL